MITHGAMVKMAAGLSFRLFYLYLSFTYLLIYISFQRSNLRKSQDQNINTNNKKFLLRYKVSCYRDFIPYSLITQKKQARCKENENDYTAGRSFDAGRIDAAC